MPMSKTEKYNCAMAKLKEMKLLAMEVQKIIKDEEINIEVASQLMDDNIYDKLEVLLNDCLLAVEIDDPSGIAPISNFEKQRRIDYGISTKRANAARKAYFEEQSLCGDVGRNKHFHY